jgi:hypothetical protein
LLPQGYVRSGVQYYLELIAKKRNELLSVVESQGDVGKQLILF